jgi:hypothetical protein
LSPWERVTSTPRRGAPVTRIVAAAPDVV